MKHLIPQPIKNLYHLTRAILANCAFAFPSRKIKVIGITGTNGKTTTTQMVTRILEKARYKVAMLSTINFKMGEREWVNDTKYTTLSAWQVQKFIAQAVREGCDYVVLETSSHSLDQHRVWGVQYDVAVITNVTREHLDYHKTMEQYRKAKRLLFETLCRSGKKSAKTTLVVNLQMQEPTQYLSCQANQKYGYYVEPEQSDNNSSLQDLRKQHSDLSLIAAQSVQLGLRGTSFSVQGQAFHLRLVGSFNIENALAAICVGLSQEIRLNIISEALSEISKVPGRMDYVENDQGLNIIIDYALTPDSMEKLGALIEKIKGQGKVLWVFGSCGERDRGKRPIMGEIVAQHADYAIVTNEDPYHEDPNQIIEEVFSGVVGSVKGPYHEDSKFKQEGIDAWKIMDRKEAIRKAIHLAKAGDVILITGKGAEEIMLVGDKKIPWNDRQVIEQVLREEKLVAKKDASSAVQQDVNQ